MKLEQLVRPNIRDLKPYSSARSEFTGEASVFLDANESPFDNGFNRYPDPLQFRLKDAIGALKQLSSEQLFLGNGSDEAIDLLFRVFCAPGKDNVVAPDPTYGMYEVCAEINNVAYRKVALGKDYALPVEALLGAVDEHTKMLFICSPNNPTGNSFPVEAIERVLHHFKGIVVVDEAYIDFSSQLSFSTLLARYPHLVVLQTFSKAWGQASIRLGMAFASPEIIAYLNKVKYPYNINILTQKHALQLLCHEEAVREQVERILVQRQLLAEQLAAMPIVLKVYPSDANFILVKVADANHVYRLLSAQGVIVRNRNSVALCEGCLRISIGTEHENAQLIEALKAMEL